MAYKKPHRKLSVLFETSDGKLLHDLAARLGTSVNDICGGCAERCYGRFGRGWIGRMTRLMVSDFGRHQVHADQPGKPPNVFASSSGQSRMGVIKLQPDA
ncbi:MAG TPA: hypothetical protein VM165_07195 [Planctomycetaceae bacterium]|nr:hypothetical protein [Planctomycetaceae bacterium]